MARIFLIAALFAGAIALSGCLEVSVRTSVSADGGSDRTVTIKSGKEDISGLAFPKHNEPEWTVTRAETTSNGKNEYTYVMKRHFSAPEALGAAYAAMPDTTALRVSASLEKSFAWFYTYLHYTETYHFNDPFGTVAPSTVFDAPEIDRFMKGDDDSVLKAKYDEWELRVKFDAGFTELLHRVEARPDGGTLAAMLREKREAVLQAARSANDSLFTGGEHGDGSTDPDSSTNSLDTAILAELMTRYFADATGTAGLRTLKPEILGAMRAMEERDRRWGSLGDGYTNGVDMPGLLLETNSSEVKGNFAAWKFNAQQIRVHDAVMTASSRVANVWAFVVTGAGLVVLVALSLYSFMIARKRSR